ncbi:MAG: hypothetical protein DI535_03790 [Citrobacter freundii]|nr:MAG: hypothetical protein DI535_03790 [Citrobacter freundii]
MLNAISYTRTSQDEDNDQIVFQELAIQKWVVANKVQLISSFSDTGYSDETLDRPSFKQMQEFMANHHLDIDLLLVLSPDRLGYCTEEIFPFLIHANEELQIQLMRVDYESLKVDPPDKRKGFWY